MRLLTTMSCMMLAAAAMAAEDNWLKSLRPDHPRMFFNAETWPSVKARALGAERERWEKLLKEVGEYPLEPTCSGTEAVVFGTVKTKDGEHKITANTPINSVQEWGTQACKTAFAWRMTGNPAYLELARKMLEVSVAAYHEAYKNGRAVNWYSTTRVLALTAYDWIYEALTPEQRKALIVPLVQHVDDIQPGPGKPRIIRRNTGGISTGFYGVDNLLWFSGLAAYGDGFCDDMAEKHLRRGYDLNQQLLKYRSEGAGDDGALSSAVSGYCMGAYPWSHFNFMHTFISAFGENPAKQWPAMALFPNWIYWYWIPADDDLRRPFMFGFGDTQHFDNRLETWMLYEHMTQYMHFFKDANPQAARLAASLRELAPNQSIGSAFPMYPFLLTSVDDVKPYPREALEKLPLKARHFVGLGEFMMRSSWTPDGTFCLFTAGAKMTQHKHHDENNFVIYRKGFLALDSGTRGYETDYNLKHYYSQTVAHNCILIHKPNEPFAGYWGMGYPGPEGKLNHGGMYDGTAQVLAFQTNDTFTYIASDATKLYRDKCTEAVRQFVFLMPDYFIVYDRVGTSNADYKKEWLLHTEQEPVITGNVLRADQWKGRLFCETLLPQQAVLTKVGGPGKEFWACGKNWEVDDRVLNNVANSEKRTGRESLMGKWRLEVSPAAANITDRFLHVLTACDQTVTVPVAAKLVTTATEDGVEVTLPDGVVATVFFNRTGDVGARMRVVRGGQPQDFALPNTVQPQAGVFEP